jgi:hypothetical protein
VLSRFDLTRRLEVLPAVNWTIVVNGSTLHTTQAASTFAITLSYVHVINSSIAVAYTCDTAVTGGLSAAVSLTKITLLSVTVSIVLTHVTTSVLLYLDATTVERGTSLVLQVVDNITFASIIPLALVNVNQVTISNSSSVQVLLPPDVRVASGVTSLNPTVLMSKLAVSSHFCIVISDSITNSGDVAVRSNVDLSTLGVEQLKFLDFWPTSLDHSSCVAQQHRVAIADRLSDFFFDVGIKTSYRFKTFSWSEPTSH